LVSAYRLERMFVGIAALIVTILPLSSCAGL